MDITSLKQDITFDATLQGKHLSFHSTWGLFSPRGIDEGTQLLAKHLKLPKDAAVLDLGCGYGPLGLLAAKLAPEGQVRLVDKDFVAVDYANFNAQLNHLPNAQAYLSNGFSAVPADAQFDAIISNIPAKIGNELLQIFLADAKTHLKPGGQLYIVVISGLKDYMKRHLTEHFGNYEKLGQSKTYTASRAIRE
ncbi:MAG TPA: methyltransferase [Candidatus Saccharimonadia bacterium]